MRGARPERALERHAAERIAPRAGEVLVAAVSGGPDSVALAALAWHCAAAAGASLVLAHVDHRVRASSRQDAAVVLAVGAALGVRVVLHALPEGPANEARLREERYARLVRTAREVGAERVLTAHHAEDQSETVLLALFRGAGPEALRGMPFRRPLGDGVSVERPLLRVARRELAAYGARLGLPTVLDPSNRELHYRRNALRFALVSLRESFPRLDEAIARCAEIAEEDARGTKRARFRARLRRELLMFEEGTRDIPFERLDAVARSWEQGRSGRHFLRRGVELRLESRSGEQTHSWNT